MTKDNYLIAFFPLVMTLVGMSFVYGLYTDQDQLVVIAFTAVCLSLFFSSAQLFLKNSKTNKLIPCQGIGFMIDLFLYQIQERVDAPWTPNFPLPSISWP